MLLTSEKRERKRKRLKAVPRTIREHRLGWLLRQGWHKAHNFNQMFSAVACARPGAGKSWVTLSLAEILDRASDDKPRFSIERVYFTTSEFAAGLSKNWPKGTVHVFDDAGINLFSREAMLQSVRDLAKIFQSVRYKNYILLLSLPGLGMLDKVVRSLMDIYIEPVEIDYGLEQTKCKYQWIQTSPRGFDKIYHHRPQAIEFSVHPLFGYRIAERKDFDFVWVERPSVGLVGAYEKSKHEHMDAYFKAIASKLELKEKGLTKETVFKQIFAKVQGNVAAYKTQGVPGVDYRKVCLLENCHPWIAKEVVKIVNLGLGALPGGPRWTKERMKPVSYES